MHPIPLALLSCAISTSSVLGLPGGPYTFAGLNLSAGGWQWTGPGMDGLRAAIENPANFGAGGVVEVSATTATLATLDLPSLAAIDCFVAPAIADAQLSAPQRQLLVDWFLAGGDLLLLDDRSDYDPVGEALGQPTLAGPGFGSGSFVATAVGSGPLVTGPFGGVASFLQYYLVGHLDAGSVVAAGGEVAATNSQGVAVALWERGAFGPTAGRLVIVTDVDTFADGIGYSGGADYISLNSNARLALNTVAFFLSPPPCVGDLDHDGDVDGADLGLLLAAWAGSGEADLDESGAVDGADLGLLLAAWGACPSPGR